MYGGYSPPQQQQMGYGTGGGPMQGPCESTWPFFDSLMKSSPMGYSTLDPQQQYKLYILWQKYIEGIRGSPIISNQQYLLESFYSYLNLHKEFFQQQQQPQSFATFFAPPQGQQPQRPPEYVPQYTPIQYGQSQGVINSMSQPFTGQQPPPPYIPPLPLPTMTNYQQQRNPAMFQNVVSQPPPPPPPQTNSHFNLESTTKKEIWKATTDEFSISFKSKMGKPTTEQVQKVIAKATEINYITTDKSNLYSGKFSEIRSQPYAVIGIYVIPFQFDAPNLGWKYVNYNIPLKNPILFCFILFI